MLIAELFDLAKSESAGTLFVVFNKATANSATDPALHGFSYAYGSLNSVLCSAKGRAVVATFLDDPTTYASQVQLTLYQCRRTEPDASQSSQPLQPTVPYAIVTWESTGLTLTMTTS